MRRERGGYLRIGRVRVDLWMIVGVVGVWALYAIWVVWR